MGDRQLARSEKRMARGVRDEARAVRAGEGVIARSGVMVRVVVVVWMVACLVGVLGGMSGCEGAGGKAGGGAASGGATSGAAVRPTVEPPSYAEVAKNYNARVRRLEAFKASADVLLETVDPNGKREEHQAEASLQFIRPSKVSLRIDKVSNTIFLMGSNAESYWWLDLTADEKTALVGSVSKATRESGEAFGVPVHPLDFIELLAILPLPEAMGDGRTPAGRGVVRWSADGVSLAVTMPAREGFKRLIVNPKDYSATRVELLDDVFRPVVTARLDKYQKVNVVGEAAAGAWVATRVDIDVSATKSRMSLTLFNLTNPGVEKFKAIVFDLPFMLKDRGIQRVISLDDRPRRAQARGDGAGTPGR